MRCFHCQSVWLDFALLIGDKDSEFFAGGLEKVVFRSDCPFFRTFAHRIIRIVGYEQVHQHIG